MRTVLFTLAVCLLVAGAVLAREWRVEAATAAASSSLLDRQQSIRSEVLRSGIRIVLLKGEIRRRIEQLSRLRTQLEEIQALKARLTDEMRHMCVVLDSPDNAERLDGKWLPFWLDGAKRERVVEDLATALHDIRARERLKEEIEAALRGLDSSTGAGEEAKL
ncbi:hypothetical protein DND132_2461 [Pseudodesulfovibrio mercurii]|uniref:Uncharacterized protein n=1 Tax=Pseudodesulfovibrio mercurii TaxID=641491 RepID=F0JCI4_9BACT|nr:hypothetical protein [Pseudodesulfovibrio mercurii]EGB15664.1 hypothetical protein DND132_2461 [Pseudodesulfovibrio mercurii]